MLDELYIETKNRIKYAKQKIEIESLYFLKSQKCHTRIDSINGRSIIK